MPDIFTQLPASIIEIPDGHLIYRPSVFSPDESDYFLQTLLTQTHWTNRTIHIYGKSILMPRLIAWHADPGILYDYSNGSSPHNPWSNTLLSIKAVAETVSNSRFNGVLLNYYRNGQDSMGWHSDNEPSLGDKPTIASISFGATRTFELKHKFNRNHKKLKLNLEHGSLLIMQGDTQTFWQHCIPKDRHTMHTRINLTFRYITPSLTQN